MQLQALKAFLNKHGSITPLQALRELGIYRLSARIHDLRGRGMDITTVVKSTNGKRYAKYTLTIREV